MILKGLDRTGKPIEVTIEGKKIKKVVFLDSKKNNFKNYILPGFIDIHTHGGYGTDFVDNSESSTRQYLKEVNKEGTTSIVHATVTTKYDNLLNSIATARTVMDNPKENESRYLGINIEGNFLNKEKKGAHDPKLLVPLTKKHVDELIYKDNILMISAAYETCESAKIVDYVSSKDVIPSLAHSMATADEFNKFFKNGLKGMTHTFNAIKPFNHRENTALLQSLLNDKIYTEIIVDGIHVHPDVIKMLYKLKPKDKVLIITDSVGPKGLKDGDYKLGELDIYKKDNVIRTKVDDALAGSIATMEMCFKNYIEFTGATLEEASKATSTNQANYLGIKNLGKIKEGYLADITIVDKNYNVVETIVNGKSLFKK